MSKQAYIFTLLIATVVLWTTDVRAGAINSPLRGADRAPVDTKIKYIMPGHIHPARAKASSDRHNTITPYGDFCTRCSKYGIGKGPISKDKAIAALKFYFNRKGLKIANIKGRGRFLIVDIYKEDKLVDRVLFDRRTGRIRSIF